MTFLPRTISTVLCVFACSANAQPDQTIGKLTSPQYMSLFAATTQSGKHLSGAEVLKASGIAYLMPQKPARLRSRRLTLGVVLMHVQTGGAITRVEMLRSVGDTSFDKEIVAMFQNAKCRPNSVRELRIPVYYQ